MYFIRTALLAALLAALAGCADSPVAPAPDPEVGGVVVYLGGGEPPEPENPKPDPDPEPEPEPEPEPALRFEFQTSARGAWPIVNGMCEVYVYGTPVGGFLDVARLAFQVQPEGEPLIRPATYAEGRFVEERERYRVRASIPVPGPSRIVVTAEERRGEGMGRTFSFARECR